jgi:6-phosphofructokinase 1
VVDAVLIPEVPFKIDGPTGLMAYLRGVVEKKGHAVVCLAEGAGQVRGGWVLGLELGGGLEATTP